MLRDIEELTYSRVIGFIDIIKTRKQRDEYIERLHGGITAMATVNALFARLDGQEIALDDLIGKAPWEDLKEDTASQDCEEKIEEWKASAEAKGLKVKA